jgi:AcrR family transcriptional regulator
LAGVLSWDTMRMNVRSHCVDGPPHPPEGNGLKGPKSKKKTRPPKGLRDELRRNEIVAAARECVVRRGFHAASMAEIATTARMSVGQIYRYFANKEAVVHAIVEGIVANRLQMLGETAGHPDEVRKIVDTLTGRVPDELGDDDILMLEVTAEATRSPAVAGMVRRADERLRSMALAAFERGHPKLSANAVAARIEILAVLFEGTLFRRMTVRNSQSSSLRDLYREIIGRLMSQEE